MLSSLKDACRKGLTIYVMDTAGFLAGLPLSVSRGIVVTTEGVIKEVKDSESRKLLTYALSAGKVLVVSTEGISRDGVLRVARELGELKRLSETDLDLLTLTHYLLSEGCSEVVVVSDDKSVQNVAIALGAKILGIKYRALRRPRRYVYICPICGYVSEEPGTCPKCGVELIRKKIK